MNLVCSLQNRSLHVGAIPSIAAALVLLALLHRVMLGAGIRPDVLVLGLAGELEPPELAYIVCVGMACLWAIAGRQRAALTDIQLWALGAGLLLTHYNLGRKVGEHADPRILSAMLAGVASLYSCYLCLIARIALGIMGWRDQRASGSS